MRPVSSWGRLSAEPHQVVDLSDIAALVDQMRGMGPVIPLGMGRSYGDACLNPGGTLLGTARLDRFHSFDPETGRLVCEAGVQLRDIQRFMLPRGWSLPVIPGTQIVSVGGAIANDVHGKNHHRVGSFGHHVRNLTLVRTDGQAIDCGPGVNPDLFAATVGGIGLTGLIATAELQLQPVAGPWLDTEILPYRSLDEFLTLADDSESLWEHTVSWLDCTAGRRTRGIFLRANPAVDQAGKPPVPSRRAVPLTPPLSLFNRLTLPVFNTLYYHLNAHRGGSRRRPFDTFLFPLDDVQDWNRLYGPRGFYQYQLRGTARRRAGRPARHPRHHREVGPGLLPRGHQDLRRARLARPAELSDARASPSRSTSPTGARAPSGCSSNSMPSFVQPADASTSPRTRACRATCSTRAIQKRRSLRDSAILG